MVRHAKTPIVWQGRHTPHAAMLGPLPLGRGHVLLGVGGCSHPVGRWLTHHRVATPVLRKLLWKLPVWLLLLVVVGVCAGRGSLGRLRLEVGRGVGVPLRGCWGWGCRLFMGWGWCRGCLRAELGG